MLTGISTACLYPMETERALEVMLGLGFDCFEVFANCESELTDKYIETLCKMMAARGARVYSLHLFTGSYEPFMFFSNYKRRFDDSIKQFRRYFRSARLLGASVVVFHGGHRNALMEIEEYCERFLLLSSAAGDEGVILAQENVSRCKSATAEAVKEMRKCSGGRMKFVFDLKQAVRAEQVPAEMIEAMGEDIVNVHLSDRAPERDCLLPGNGRANLAGIKDALEKTGYQGPAVIEVYRHSFENPGELLKSWDYVKRL